MSGWRGDVGASRDDVGASCDDDGLGQTAARGGIQQRGPQEAAHRRPAARRGVEPLMQLLLSEGVSAVGNLGLDF